MIKHIVLFKFKADQSPGEKSNQLRQMKEIFSPLGKALPFIVEFRTGINFNEADHAWDFAIDSVFSNSEDLEKYQKSSEHMDAVKKASSIEKRKAVIDYEF